MIDGTLTVYFRDGSVDISGGELFVVPRGVEHKTFAGRECHAMLVERAGTINTGDVVGDLTADGRNLQARISDLAMVPYGQDSPARLDFWGSDVGNPATEGDTRWVNYSMRRFSSRSMAS